MTPAEFWAKVDKNGPFQPALGNRRCWLWTGGTNNWGYGIFGGGLSKDRGHAHRRAYELLVGPIPAGHMVDHRCHVKNCVNPAHLRAIPGKKENAENHSGARSDSRSGIRGVWWDELRQRWVGQTTHNGRVYTIRLSDSREDAAAAIIELRNRLHTHNDLDRL